MGVGGCELKQVRRGCTASLARGTACGEGRVVSSPAAAGGFWKSALEGKRCLMEQLRRSYANREHK